MHEMAIAQNIINICKDSAIKNKIKKINTIYLVIGKLTAIVPESLIFCFDAIKTQNLYKNAKLEIINLDYFIYCKNCNKDILCEDPFLVCPECGGSNVTTKTGRELMITEIEGE